MKDAIYDKNEVPLAIIDVLEESPGRFRGTLIESCFPQEMISLFQEYERRANAQTYSLLDEIEQKVDAYELYLKSKKSRVRELQVMDKNKISFCVK